MSSNPPMVTVACSNTACPAHGVQRRVRLQPAGPGFLAAPRLLCSTCGAEPVTVSGWPPTNDVGGDEMAKITVHSGASDKRDPAALQDPDANPQQAGEAAQESQVEAAAARSGDAPEAAEATQDPTAGDAPRAAVGEPTQGEAEVPAVAPSTDTAGAAAGPGEQDDASGGQDDRDADQDAEGADQFDPGAHNMGDVLAYLDDAHARGDQAEIDRVLAAERAGKARKGILGD